MILLATELPTHRHSRRLKDIVETLTGNAATLGIYYSNKDYYITERANLIFCAVGHS